jgi:hypothetical protein
VRKKYDNTINPFLGRRQKAESGNPPPLRFGATRAGTGSFNHGIHEIRGRGKRQLGAGLKSPAAMIDNDPLQRQVRAEQASFIIKE